MIYGIAPHLFALAVLLLAGAVIVIILVFRETVAFLRLRTRYALRRYTLRLCMAGLILFLLFSMLVGVLYFHMDNPEGIARLWVTFWGCISLLTAAIFCLAIADLRLIRDETRDDASRLWREIAETIASHEARKTKDD